MLTMRTPEVLLALALCGCIQNADAAPTKIVPSQLTGLPIMAVGDFGAKCDGSDDTAAIASAKTAAAAANALLVFRGTVNSGVCHNTGVQGDIQGGSLMIPATSSQIFLDRRDRPIMPAPGHPEYPQGNDRQTDTYGPADNYMRNRASNGTASSISAGTGIAGTTTTYVVGTFTSEDCSTPPCDASSGPKTGQITGTTTILSPPTSPAFNVIEVEPDTANAESLGSAHWNIIDGTHIQFVNPTFTHSPPFVIRQRGTVAITGHYLTFPSDGVSDHPMHVRDLTGTEWVAFPSDTTGSGTWPKKGIQWTGLQTGANGVNANEIHRNATTSSCWKHQNAAGSDRVFMCEDGSGNGTLELFPGYMGVGAAPTTNIGLLVKPNATLIGNSQYAIQATPTCSSAATAECDGLVGRADTTAAAFTATNAAGLHAQDSVKGATSTITNEFGLLVDDITHGANNWAIKTGLGTVEFGGNLILHGSVTFAGAQTDSNFSAYRAVKATPAANIVFGQTKVTIASTLTADSYVIPDVVGVGPGNFVARLCSDGTTCGAGNVYLTCTVACTVAVGTPAACAVTKSAVSAGTTLSWEVGTACATTDPGVNVNAHYTTP